MTDNFRQLTRDLVIRCQWHTLLKLCKIDTGQLLVALVLNIQINSLHIPAFLLLLLGFCVTG